MSLHCYHGESQRENRNLHESAPNGAKWHREMKNKKTTMTDKEGNDEMCGKAEISQPAEEMSERKLVSCSDRLKLNSANVEQKETNIQGHPDRDEQPESDDTHALPVLFNLVVQR